MFAALLDLPAQRVGIGDVPCAAAVGGQVVPVLFGALDLEHRAARRLALLGGGERGTLGMNLSLLKEVGDKTALLGCAQIAHQILDGEVCIIAQSTEDDLGNTPQVGVMECAGLEPLGDRHKSAVFCLDRLRAKTGVMDEDG